MTPQEVKELFEKLVDDTIDEDLAYALMDSAYTNRNELRPWAMLTKLDTSLSHSTSDTWQTEKTLPSDFARPYKLVGGAADNTYIGVLFENILQHITEGNRYAVDMANLKLRLTGTVSTALTMYFWYIYAPTSLVGLSDAQKISATTIVWPARFRALLAYDMADMYFGGIDADDMTRSMSPHQRAAAKTLEASMIKWDNSIRLKMMDSASVQSRGGSSRPDVIDM